MCTTMSRIRMVFFFVNLVFYFPFSMMKRTFCTFAKSTFRIGNARFQFECLKLFSLSFAFVSKFQKSFTHVSNRFSSTVILKHSTLKKLEKKNHMLRLRMMSMVMNYYYYYYYLYVYLLTLPKFVLRIHFIKRYNIFSLNFPFLHILSISDGNCKTFKRIDKSTSSMFTTRASTICFTSR